MWAEKLKTIVSDLSSETDRVKLGDLWKSAGSTLQRTGVDKMKAARVVAMRDMEGLKVLVSEISKNPQLGVQQRYVPSRPSTPDAASASTAAAAATASSPAVALAEPPRPAPAPAAPPTEAELNTALKAFRKRLKVTQLDADSKISSRRLTTGKREGVVAIAAPNTHPRAVWEALVEKGKLRRSGGGLYELIDN